MVIIAAHSYVRQYKLKDVVGKIDYISNPERQEHLYEVYGTVRNPEFWKYLAEQNQHDFKMSGSDGECIEARELVIALPKSFVDYDKKLMLQFFVESFKERYGVECTAALHHNKTMENLHIHLIYSERKILEHTEVKKATRNMFYDEQGKHVRTKKEILDAEGKLRKGCYIIPKGETYDIKWFAPKEQCFKDSKFIPSVKEFMTERINMLVQNEEEKLQVFDSNGPYLATKKIGKNNPKADIIRADNEKRQEWNRNVDEALVAGVPSEDIMLLKKAQIQEAVKESVNENGNRPDLLQDIIQQAITALSYLIQSIKMPKRKKLNVDIEEYKRMQAVKEKLDQVMVEIKKIDRRIEAKQSYSEKLTRVIDRGKKIKTIKEIAALLVVRSDKQSELNLIVKKAGYKDVAKFMKAYNKSTKLMEEYLASSAESNPEARKSVIAELNRLREEAKTRQHYKPQAKTAKRRDER